MRSAEEEIRRINIRLCKINEILRDLESGTTFPRVLNFSALPPFADNIDKVYIVEQSQGVPYTPDWFFGEYKPKGFYYSNGIKWEYAGDFPFNATQPTVDAGTNNDQFLTPLTFTNATKWNDKANTSHTHPISDVAFLQDALDSKLSSVPPEYVTELELMAELSNYVEDTDVRLSDARTPTAHMHPQSDIIDLPTDLANKQDTLVSSTNIKTVNGSSLLGAGDLTVGVADGVDTVLFAQKKVALWAAIPNSITPNSFAFITPVTTGFTPQTRAVAATNLFTRSARVGYQTAATVGQLGQFRTGSSAYTVGDLTTSLGGFTFIITFGISDPSAVATARMFLGMKDLVVPTNVEPSTLTNCIGIGHGAANTNLFLYYGGSSAQTPIDLGPNFPITHGSVNVYRLALYSAPNSGDVQFKVTRVNTGDIATGTITNTGATVLPTNTTYLNLWGYRTNNATGAAVAIDVMKMYIETDY